MQKQYSKTVAFLAPNNKHTEKFRGKYSFHNGIQIMKYLGISIRKEIQDLYIEYFSNFKNQIKDTTRKWKDIP